LRARSARGIYCEIIRCLPCAQSGVPLPRHAPVFRLHPSEPLANSLRRRHQPLGTESLGTPPRLVRLYRSILGAPTCLLRDPTASDASHSSREADQEAASISEDCADRSWQPIMGRLRGAMVRSAAAGFGLVKVDPPAADGGRRMTG